MTICVRLLTLCTGKTSLIFYDFMTEVDFQIGAKCPGKLASYLPTETGKQGCYLPQCLNFKKKSPRFLRQSFLGHKADKRPIQFPKGFIYILKRGESTYKGNFSKVSTLRKRNTKKSLPLFSTGRIKLLFFNFYLFLHKVHLNGLP